MRITIRELRKKLKRLDELEDIINDSELESRDKCYYLKNEIAEKENLEAEELLTPEYESDY